MHDWICSFCVSAPEKVPKQRYLEFLANLAIQNDNPYWHCTYLSCSDILINPGPRPNVNVDTGAF